MDDLFGGLPPAGTEGKPVGAEKSAAGGLLPARAGEQPTEARKQRARAEGTAADSFQPEMPGEQLTEAGEQRARAEGTAADSFQPEMPGEQLTEAGRHPTDILLGLLERSMPEALKKAELRILMGLTASAAGRRPPSLRGKTAAESLALYRAFTASAASAGGNEIRAFRAALYKKAYRVGRLLALIPGMRDPKRKKRLIILLYRNIEIYLQSEVGAACLRGAARRAKEGSPESVLQGVACTAEEASPESVLRGAARTSEEASPESVLRGVARRVEEASPESILQGAARTSEEFSPQSVLRGCGCREKRAGGEPVDSPEEGPESGREENAVWRIRIPRCSFSSAYTPRTCYVMSGLDAGIICGVFGGGRLSFDERITEGRSCCRAVHRLT